MMNQRFAIAALSIISILTYQPTAQSLHPPSPILLSRTASSLPNGTSIAPPQGQGRGTLRIINGNTSDVAVKLVDRASGRTLRFIYVGANQEVTLPGIPTCTCVLKYSTGSQWNQNARRFTRNAAFFQLDPLLYFTEARSRLGIRPKIYTAKLYRRPDGNAPSTAISEGNF